MWQLRSLHGSGPNEAQKRKMQEGSAATRTVTRSDCNGRPGVSLVPVARGPRMVGRPSRAGGWGPLPVCNLKRARVLQKTPSRSGLTYLKFIMTLLSGDCDTARRCSRRLNPRPRREVRCALNCRRLQPSPIQNRQQELEIANLSLFAAFTAALFSSSAFTLSVWPLEDARYSAVFLHGADTLHHEPKRRTQWPARAAIAHATQARMKTRTC
jgi:hypothetical protein